MPVGEKTATNVFWGVGDGSVVWVAAGVEVSVGGKDVGVADTVAVGCAVAVAVGSIVGKGVSLGCGGTGVLVGKAVLVTGGVAVGGPGVSVGGRGVGSGGPTASRFA